MKPPKAYSLPGFTLPEALVTMTISAIALGLCVLVVFPIAESITAVDQKGRIDSWINSLAFECQRFSQELQFAYFNSEDVIESFSQAQVLYSNNDYILIDENTVIFCAHNRQTSIASLLPVKLVRDPETAGSIALEITYAQDVLSLRIQPWGMPISILD